jgi:diguanylate cyclase (GGDEF)-like protein
LANPRAFYEAAVIQLEQHRRYQHVISVAYLDLDGFKHVNDRLGHLGADRLLQKVASLLQRGTRATDVVARLGGDEFCILYPEMGARELERALARLQSTVREGLRDEEIPVSFSIGAVTFAQAPKTVEALLAAADELMYEVKAAGKDAIRTKVAGSGPGRSGASRAAEPER